MIWDAEEERRLQRALSQVEDLLQKESWREPEPKSAAESSLARRAGNELYAQLVHGAAGHLEALECYSRSVAFAPNGSNELALAYGNRSALLKHLGRHVDAIADIDRALLLPLDELRVAKYLCRKVECQAELKMEEAKETCEETKFLLQHMKASVETKKSIIIKLVDAIVKLEKRNRTEVEQQMQLIPVDTVSQPISDVYRKNHLEMKFQHQPRSSECPDSTSALAISRNKRYVRRGRHLTATRDIIPGELLYSAQPYVSFPVERRVHTHCSHCLSFAWAAKPCTGCSQAVYCSESCLEEAWLRYHDVECRVIERAWKNCGNMNAGRLLSVRLLILAVREAGDLPRLRRSLEEVDACEDPRKKGFSENETVFAYNHRSVYSLMTNVKKKSNEQLEEVSKDSAVLLHLLAKHTKFFRKYFDCDKKALARSEDALFVGKLLSHFQHVVIINGTMVKDAYNVSTTDWSWTTPQEENCTGIYLNPFLSLLNHSCNPNVARCESEDRKTILYALRPIAKGEQIFECYGPMYSEMPKNGRQELIKRFCFTCDCIACENDWPIFMNMISSGVMYLTLSHGEIDATVMAQRRCDKIQESLKNRTYRRDFNALEELSYAIVLTEKYCKLPNWRLPSLVSTLTNVFDEIFGFVIRIPEVC